MIIVASFLLTGCNENSAPEKMVSAQSQDTLLFGGPIYTGDDENPLVEALLIRKDKIAFVGTEHKARSLAKEGLKEINLDGAAAFPGFADSHVHLLGIGNREIEFDLSDVSSIAEMKTRVAAEVAKLPKGETLFGDGWIETHWPEKRMPTRYDLDEVSPDHPVMLGRVDGHMMLFNSLALELSNVDSTTVSPEGGKIVKGPDGQPNGHMLNNAMAFGDKLMPVQSLDQMKEAMAAGAEVMARKCWTSVHNMSVGMNRLPLFKELAKEGRLPIRVYNALGATADNLAFTKLEPEIDSDLQIVRTRSVKLFADGSLGARGAALFEPYSDMSDSNGLMLMDEERVMPFLEHALKSGIQVTTHAIGPRANRLVLDWYERAFNSVPVEERAVKEPRWRIEHAQIIHPDDIKRFAALGVIPSMQPSHAIGDFHFAPKRLGKERLKGAYAWNSLIDAGAMIAGGSDAPVEKGNPEIEFYAATSRHDLKGFQGEDWHPEEAVSRSQALKMLTAWPAYAAFSENDLGTLTIGKQADISVMSTDLMTIPEAAIPKAKCMMTIVGGQIQYQADRNQ